MSAALHSRRVTYGKHCLPHNTVLSWADFLVLRITQLDTERDNLWSSTVYFFYHRNQKRFTSSLKKKKIFSVSICLTSLDSVFLLFLHPVLCPVTCRCILPTNMHPVLSLIARRTHKKGPVKIISPLFQTSKRQRFFSSTFWPRACLAG